MVNRALLPTSFTCLPTGSQRFWFFATVSWNKQKFAYVNRQRGGQAIKQIDRRIEFPGFYFADGPTIDACVESEVFLADPLCGSNTSEIPCDAGASIHAEDATNLKATNLSDIADIFGKSTVRHEGAAEEMSGGAVPLLEVTVQWDVQSGGQK
ncbi:hypothetical protein MesoLj131b_01220 [Mesorhizobium sp. 131-2-5]|uniref:hypothetical protein n=1 Tax=Mesorhizobium sp. 131-2-5 TaxID=2744519 RepID=UPI001934FB29|nr:hypothetical protein MesoLj131b_01220 [Mesorhizobium sp. 131-2-5]